MKTCTSFFLLSLFCLSFCSAQEKSQAGGIQWMTFKEAMIKSEKQPKKVFIDVYTKWCGWCKKMDASSFVDPRVVSYMNEHFYPVKLDAETKDTMLYKGTSYVFKPEYKANEIAPLLLNGQMSFPTTVYLDESSNVIGPVQGYLDQDQLLAVLKYFGEDLYKSKDWQEYVRENSK